jgi:hypothetical protein
MAAVDGRTDLQADPLTVSVDVGAFLDTLLDRATTYVFSVSNGARSVVCAPPPRDTLTLLYAVANAGSVAALAAAIVDPQMRAHGTELAAGCDAAYAHAVTPAADRVASMADVARAVATLDPAPHAALMVFPDGPGRLGAPLSMPVVLPCAAHTELYNVVRGNEGNVFKRQLDLWIGAHLGDRDVDGWEFHRDASRLLLDRLQDLYPELADTFGDFADALAAVVDPETSTDDERRAARETLLSVPFTTAVRNHVVPPANQGLVRRLIQPIRNPPAAYHTGGAAMHRAGKRGRAHGGGGGRAHGGWRSGRRGRF